MDLLRWPVVGPFLRWRHARTSLQLVLLAAAVVIVLHGLVGPDLASTNLATVLTWVHYRGLLVVALLAAGNLFCLGCPLVRVRDWGRQLHMPRRAWPARLRGKWIGVALFAAVLLTYELFDLWPPAAPTGRTVRRNCSTCGPCRRPPRGSSWATSPPWSSSTSPSAARRSASTSAPSGSSTSSPRRSRPSSCACAMRTPAGRVGRLTA
jgi:hypothetical protein